MAFCTSCGGAVQGAFCPKCGTPVSAAPAQGAPTPASYPGPAAAPVAAQSPAAPARRKISPIVWILGIVGGLIVLSILCVAAAGYFFVNKAKQAGLDPELMERNPAYAMAKMAITANPDLEEVSHDEGAGTITIRDKKTGKVTTVNFGDFKDGKFRMGVTDENGNTSTIEAGDEAELPSWTPVYPGAKQEGGFSATGSGGAEEGGTASFTTSDPGSKVLSYYREKGTALGMKVVTQTASAEGGMLVMAEESGNRSLSVIVGGESGNTNIHLTYSVKK
jgi:hypothetical protein